MKSPFFLFCLMLVFKLSANDLPPTYALSGRVTVAASGEPLEYATVSAHGPDSVLVDGTVSDATGSFDLELPAGEYYLKIEFIGLETQTIPVSLQADTKLPIIALENGDLTLETVEVNAEKSQMNLLLDKKVFNVGNDALAQGGSVNQILEQLPSVEVSVDGQVSLRGNAGVRILINGRPSALANNNALESIPADNVEKIEIITNPSARYEAAGTAGIINIILKKETNRGYGGTLRL
ncbi:MAG: TonB-dependent receptor, partial [Bacteroidota bacterium]